MRMKSRLRMLGLVLALSLLVVLMACGSDEPSDGAASMPGQASGADPAATTAERDAPPSPGSGPSSSDIEAYCDALDDFDPLGDPETWGEVAQYTARAQDWLEDITPPDELREFHNAQIAYFKRSHDYYRSEDENRPYVEEETLSDPAFREILGEYLAVHEALGEETRAQLDDAGCF